MPEVIVEGKPTLFFTTHQADRDWRLKEKVVAVIESYFQEQDDLLTFSSTKIRDVVGSLEDVDVAYTSLSDPTDYFSFVEVRNRHKNVGRQYIQEIIGKRISLGLEKCKIVSTKGFSANAIRLASDQGICLRLLLPETTESIKRWFKPDFIGISNPTFRIVKCSILVAMGDRIYELKADQDKVLENNILVPTDEPHRYKVISLMRVFNIDVMQKPEGDRLLASIPIDEIFHEAPSVAVEYKDARLYLRVKAPPTGVSGKNGDPIFAIRGILFFIMINRPSTTAKITNRYKYLDAVSKEKMAELFLANFYIEHKRHYVCLMRYNCDGENCKLGGALFC